MPRQPRTILPGIPHHAIQRGNNRQRTFFEVGDHTFFLAQLKKHSAENSVGIGAYCLMLNHIHLLIYPDSREGMIRFMKMLCQSYTQYFNKKYERTGKLWENRYRSHFIDPDRAWVLSRYIEKNPVRANMIKEATDYAYSSARHNLLGQIDGIVSRRIVSKDKRYAYREFFYGMDLSEGDLTTQITAAVERGQYFGSGKLHHEKC